MRGNYEVIDEAISGGCYYFMRLPRSRLRLLAMTTWYLRNNARRGAERILKRSAPQLL
ncbi:hypothetical protein [Rickettsia hoogstraalii]|uniref:hypothetical protein n=1 Tax=Rickettsia hoogstraalii TaxID=467174 RepID=UPI000AEE446F|nr:hypothetical protein [Rickettsia hoogstraalii]